MELLEVILNVIGEVTDLPYPSLGHNVPIRTPLGRVRQVSAHHVELILDEDEVAIQVGLTGRRIPRPRVVYCNYRLDDQLGQ